MKSTSLQLGFWIVLLWLPNVQLYYTLCPGGAKCCSVYYPWWWISGRIKMSLPATFNWFKFCYFDGFDGFFRYRHNYKYVAHWAAYKNPFKSHDIQWYYRLSDDILDNGRPYAKVFDEMGRQEASSSFNGGTKLFRYYDFTHKGYHSVVAIAINLLLCEKNRYARRTCPSPCREPHICVRDENSDGVCVKVALKKKPAYIRDLYAQGYSDRLNKLYYYRGDCGCFKSYKYNSEKGFCEFTPETCVVLDRIPPCRNHGKCELLPKRLRPHKDVRERCSCPASWSGISCQLPRNPCGDYRHNPCGAFRCERSPENAYSGFKCMCTAGYRQRSVTDPVCEEIDECIEDEPCQHGGVCKNIKPPVSEFEIAPQRYKCECIRGYSGEQCQLPPSEPTWTPWGAWNTCSRTCGIGIKERRRNCTSVGKCMGIDRERVSCILLAAVCMHFEKETETWQEVRQDEDMNDAFHWNENNENVRAVFMSNIAYYLSFVFVVLGSLTFCPLVALVIGLFIFHKRAMRRIAAYEQEEGALGLEYE